MKGKAVLGYSDTAAKDRFDKAEGKKTASFHHTNLEQIFTIKVPTRILHFTKATKTLANHVKASLSTSSFVVIAHCVNRKVEAEEAKAYLRSPGWQLSRQGRHEAAEIHFFALPWYTSVRQLERVEVGAPLISGNAHAHDGSPHQEWLSSKRDTAGPGH